MDGLYGSLPQLSELVLVQVELLELTELGEGLGGDLLDAALGEVEADELGDHLEGVGLHLLQRVGVEVQLAEIRDVWK